MEAIVYMLDCMVDIYSMGGVVNNITFIIFWFGLGYMIGEIFLK